MTGTVLTYSPSNVKIIVSGYTLPGIVSISLAWNTEQFQIRRGIRGVSTRIHNKDRSARLTVEVLQTSPTNDILCQIINSDCSNEGARLSLTLSDASGGTVLYSAEAFVGAIPELNYSTDFNPVRWTFILLDVADGKITGASSTLSNLFSSSAGEQLLNSIAGIS